MKYNYLVVGSGLFGAVFAHEAKKAGKSVLVVDQRAHVGGNCHTENVDGINVHKFGPHITNTNSDRIWNYLNQFCTFNNYVNRAKAVSGDKVYSLPINLQTIYEVSGAKTPAEAKQYMDRVRVPCDDPKNLEDWALSQVGAELYELLYKGYTKKQWFRDPRDLPAFIIKRLPVRFTFDDNYYNVKHQGIPIGGYTPIFEKMLDGVRVDLGVDFFEMDDWRKYADRLVYTGKVDEYFGFCHGPLDYLTLRFETEQMEGDYQGNAIINYPEESVPYTRVVEHKHFEKPSHPTTVITREYPVKWTGQEVPYYPVNDRKNQERYEKYRKMTLDEKNVVFGGRLSRFVYANMDAIIASALTAAAKEFGGPDPGESV